MLEVNKIYCGDCLELMPQIENKSIDLIVTSPPYNMGGISKNKDIGKIYPEYHDNLTEEQYVAFLNKCLDEMIRISRYTCFNIQYLSKTKNAILELLFSHKNNLKDIVIWKKQAVCQAELGVLSKGFEFIFIFGDNDKMKFDYNNFPKNNYISNIQTWTNMISIKGHHATFPPEIPEYFIKFFSKEGDIILDPFIGTGTTAMMAKYLNRKYIGIDISKKCCEISKIRVDQLPNTKLERWLK